MTPRTTTIKHKHHGRGKIHAFEVAIVEPGRAERYDILAKTGAEAVQIARERYDHPLWAIPRNLLAMEAA